jgi:hypothetical protein
MVRRDLAATAAPSAATSTGASPTTTFRPVAPHRLRREGEVLSDGEAQEERTPTRRSGRLCRRRGRLCMRRRWGRSVRCGPGRWSVAGLPGPAGNSGVGGQNSRSVPRGGYCHPVLLQVLHARMDMGTVRRQRSQTRSGGIACPVAWPEPQTRLSHMLSDRYERSPWPVGAS